MKFIVDQFGSVAVAVISGVFCLSVFFICFQNIASMFGRLVSVIQ